MPRASKLSRKALANSAWSNSSSGEVACYKSELPKVGNQPLLVCAWSTYLFLLIVTWESGRHWRIRTSLKNQDEQIVVLTRPYNWYTWPENSRAHFKILSSDSKQRLKGVNDGLIPAPPSTVQELTLAHTETLAKLKVQPQWSPCTSPAPHGQDFISKYEHHALKD